MITSEDLDVLVNELLEGDYNDNTRKSCPVGNPDGK